jgi:16S rRNA (cytidine1402-2'-O)-methyltransferase
MSKLYVVPTPIGNLGDITLRAIKILGEVDVILAEDTRTTKNLLKHYRIETKLEAYHIYNEHRTASLIAERIEKGETMALVSDAGTPSISDPGYLLVNACLANSVAVECLPGPVALVPALVTSGFPSDRFCFEGFLPHKKGRMTRIEELAREKRTIILYESPHRIARTLRDLQALGPQRRCTVSREISKIHEETIRGTIEELVKHFETTAARGEMVIVINAD